MINQLARMFGGNVRVIRAGELESLERTPRRTRADEFREIISSLVKYSKKQGVDAVFFVDTSARPAASAFRQSWKIQNPRSSKMPKTLFLNPDGFITQELVKEMSETDYSALVSLLRKKKGDLREADLKIVGDGALGSDKQCLEQLEKVFSMNGLSKKSKVLIYDTCAHTGNTLNPIKRLLKQFGASNVSFGLASQHLCDDSVKVDHVGVPYMPQMSCRPFSGSSAEVIVRAQQGIHSALKYDGDREDYIETKQVIRDIIDGKEE